LEKRHRRLAAQKRSAQISIDRGIEFAGWRVGEVLLRYQKTRGVDKTVKRTPGFAEARESLRDRFFNAAFYLDGYRPWRRRVLRKRGLKIKHCNVVAVPKASVHQAAPDAAAASKKGYPPFAHSLSLLMDRDRRAMNRTGSILGP
jgi:hypothetical protein